MSEELLRLHQQVEDQKQTIAFLEASVLKYAQSGNQFCTDKTELHVLLAAETQRADLLTVEVRECLTKIRKQGEELRQRETEAARANKLQSDLNFCCEELNSACEERDRLQRIVNGQAGLLIEMWSDTAWADD